MMNLAMNSSTFSALDSAQQGVSFAITTLTVIYRIAFTNQITCYFANSFKVKLLCVITSIWNYHVQGNRMSARRVDEEHVAGFPFRRLD